MNMRHWLCTAVVLCGAAALAGTAIVRAQGEAQPVINPHATMKLGAFPNLPTCVAGAAEHGDPMKEASTLLVRTAPGCSVPWHWHTPDEVILAVSGSLRVEMKGGDKPLYMHGGDYAMMPSHHVHQARCAGAAPCVFFLHSSAAFDIHYVDASGNEIPMSDALKPMAKAKGAGCH